MPVELFRGYQSELLNPLLKRKIHIICVAVKAITSFSIFTEGCGIPIDTAETFAADVNENNKPNNLFPLNLTAFPLSKFKDRDDVGNEELMKSHISNCFEIETEIINSNNMLFMFEKREDFDSELAVRILLENWADTPINVEYIPD